MVVEHRVEVPQELLQVEEVVEVVEVDEMGVEHKAEVQVVDFELGLLAEEAGMGIGIERRNWHSMGQHCGVNFLRWGCVSA